ncbi:MAG: pyruvate dehydrogenase (acetyl-transferring) E1 component subunit alpha [Polyangiales bacterium]
MSALDPARLGEMLLIRRFEERCAEVYTQQKIRGFLHLYVGEEAVAVGAMRAFRREDAIVTAYREHGQALARGIPPECLMAEMYGKSNGCARGRGGSMHLFDVGRRFYGGYAIVGGGIPIAVGLALAEKVKKTGAIVACFFGDGATAEGVYHESLNLASVWKLPVLFLCENNLYAMGTAIERYAADTELVHEPAAHAIPAESIDGMDLGLVEDTVQRAADAVRSSGTPRFVELRTYRFRAHSMYDAERYRDKAEVAKWRERDPIETYAKRLIEAGLLDDRRREELDRSVMARVDEAVRVAENGPLEPVEDLTKDIYAAHGSTP